MKSRQEQEDELRKQMEKKEKALDALSDKRNQLIEQVRIFKNEMTPVRKANSLKDVVREDIDKIFEKNKNKDGEWKKIANFSSDDISQVQEKIRAFRDNLQSLCKEDKNQAKEIGGFSSEIDKMLATRGFPVDCRRGFELMGAHSK